MPSGRQTVGCGDGTDEPPLYLNPCTHAPARPKRHNRAALPGAKPSLDVDPCPALWLDVDVDALCAVRAGIKRERPQGGWEVGRRNREAELSGPLQQRVDRRRPRHASERAERPRPSESRRRASSAQTIQTSRRRNDFAALRVSTRGAREARKLSNRFSHRPDTVREAMSGTSSNRSQRTPTMRW